MKCPYCQNTGRRHVGTRTNGNKLKVACEVCDWRERQQLRALLRARARAEKNGGTQ